MLNSKIFIVYHKPADLVQNDTFVPIRVGHFANDVRNDWLTDNVGENISIKNSSYNEMTAIYWLWKNYDEIGNPDIIGICHYRRYFIFKGSKYAYFEHNEVKNIFKTINFSYGKIEDIFARYDFVAPVPSKRKSVYHNYKVSHCIEDLDLALNIIKERHEEFVNAAEKYVHGKGAYLYNMFIFKKEDFFNYCEWIFDILSVYEKKTQHTGGRFFISERLTGIYFTYLQMNGKRAAHLPVLFIKDKRPKFKQIKMICKQNLQDNNISRLYAYKPLLSYFIPNRFWVMRRRKSTLKNKDRFN